jgi:hypothetical protein
LDFIKTLNEHHAQQNPAESELASASPRMNWRSACKARRRRGGSFEGNRGHAQTLWHGRPGLRTLRTQLPAGPAAGRERAFALCSFLAAATQARIPGMRTANSRKNHRKRAAGVDKPMRGF